MGYPKYDINTPGTVLLIVDPQRAFGDAVSVPDVNQAVNNMRRAAQAWRSMSRPVMLTKHSYHQSSSPGRLEDFLPGIKEVLGDGAPLTEFYKGVCRLGDGVIVKRRFDATFNTLLVDALKGGAFKAETVVVAGLTTPICVQTTVDALMMRDFRVILLHDACASQALGGTSAQEAHYAAVERMRALFAQVISVDEFVAQLS